MTSIEEQLNAIIETGVPGVAAVVDGPNGLIEAASGMADLATGAPLTTAHRFRIGSDRANDRLKPP